VTDGAKALKRVRDELSKLLNNLHRKSGIFNIKIVKIAEYNPAFFVTFVTI